MWRQSLAEKKGVSPSEALSPDQTPSVAPLRLFSFDVLVPIMRRIRRRWLRLAPVMKPASSDAR